jgi:hypothetical protein
MCDFGDLHWFGESDVHVGEGMVGFFSTEGDFEYGLVGGLIVRWECFPECSCPTELGCGKVPARRPLMMGRYETILTNWSETA